MKLFNYRTIVRMKYPVGNVGFVLISTLSLIVFLMCKLSIPTEINRIPEFVYSLVFLGALCTRVWLVRYDFGAQAFLASIMIVFLLLGVNYLQVGDQALELFDATQLIKLTFFVVVGTWLGGDLQRIYVFLFVAAIGLIIALFQVDYIKEFQKLFAGKRIDFNLHNAQHISMYFGLMLIGSLSVIPKVVSLNQKSWLTWLVWGFLFVCVSLSILILIGAQTRAAWIGLIVVFLSLSVVVLFKLNVRYFAVLAVLFIGLIVGFFMGESTFKSRVLKEVDVVAVFLDEGVSSVPYTSIGIRLHTWAVALDRIKEKPIVGYGAKVRKSVIQDSPELPSRIKKEFGHFHNSYIEFTLAYGLIGLVFLLAMFGWVNYRMYNLSRKHQEYRPVWYFTFYGSIFMAVINTFESYVFFWTGVYTMSILLAPAYSLHLVDVYENKVINKK